MSQQYRELKRALHIDQNSNDQQQQIKPRSSDEDINFVYPKPTLQDQNEHHSNENILIQKKSPIDMLSVYNTLNFQSDQNSIGQMKQTQRKPPLPQNQQKQLNESSTEITNNDQVRMNLLSNFSKNKNFTNLQNAYISRENSQLIEPNSATLPSGNSKLPRILTNTNDLINRFKIRENQAIRQINSTKNQDNNNLNYFLPNQNLIQNHIQQVTAEDEQPIILVDPDVVYKASKPIVPVQVQERMFVNLHQKLQNFQRQEVTTQLSKLNFLPDENQSKLLSYPSQTYVKAFKPDFKMDPKTVIDQIRKRQLRDQLVKIHFQREQQLDLLAENAIKQQQNIPGIQNNIPTISISNKQLMGQSNSVNAININKMTVDEKIYDQDKIFPLKKFLKDASIKELIQRKRNDKSEPRRIQINVESFQVNTQQQSPEQNQQVQTQQNVQSLQVDSQKQEQTKAQNAQQELRRVLQMARLEKQKKEEEEQKKNQQKLEQERLEKEKQEMASKLGKFTPLGPDGKLPQNGLSAQEQLKNALLEARRRKREEEEKQKTLLMDGTVKVQIDKHKQDIKQAEVAANKSPTTKSEAQLAQRIKAPTISINQGKTEEQLAEEQKVKDAQKRLREALQEAKRLKQLKEQEEQKQFNFEQDEEFKQLTQDLNAEKAKIFIENYFRKQFAPLSHQNDKDYLKVQSSQQNSSLFQKLLQSKNLWPFKANKMMNVVKNALQLKLSELQDTLKRQKTEKEQELMEHERKYKESLNQQVLELENLINQLDNPMLNNSANMNDKGTFLNLDNISFKGQEFDAFGQAGSRMNINQSPQEDDNQSDMTLNLTMKTINKESVVDPKIKSRLQNYQTNNQPRSVTSNRVDQQAKRIQMNFNQNTSSKPKLENYNDKQNTSNFKQYIQEANNWNTESKHLQKKQNQQNQNQEEFDKDIEETYTEDKKNKERRNRASNKQQNQIKQQKISEIRDYINQSLKPQIKLSNSKYVTEKAEFEETQTPRKSFIKLQPTKLSERSTKVLEQQTKYQNTDDKQNHVYRVQNSGPQNKFKKQLKQLLNVDQHQIRTYDDEIREEIERNKRNQRKQQDEDQTINQVKTRKKKKHKLISNSKVTSFASISSTPSSPFKMSYMNTGVLSRDEEIKKSLRRSRKAFHYKNPDYQDFEDEYEKMKEQEHENQINQARDNQFKHNQYTKIKTSNFHRVQGDTAGGVMHQHPSSSSISNNFGQSSSSQSMTMPFYSQTKLGKYISDKNLVYN